MTTTLTPRPRPAAADGRPAAVGPLVAVLRQLAAVVDALTDEQYTRKPVGGVPSSVGGHVRHCLDHLDALLAAVPRGTLDYDDRRPGSAVETARQSALDAIARLQRQLLDLPPGADRRPLRLTTLVSPDRPPVGVMTSVGRELAFVLSHTIHHNALVGVMARALGVPLPDRFGYAPSTIARREAHRCVR